MNIFSINSFLLTNPESLTSTSSSLSLFFVLFSLVFPFFVCCDESKSHLSFLFIRVVVKREDTMTILDQLTQQTPDIELKNVYVMSSLLLQHSLISQNLFLFQSFGQRNAQFTASVVVWTLGSCYSLFTLRRNLEMSSQISLSSTTSQHSFFDFFRSFNYMTLIKHTFTHRHTDTHIISYNRLMCLLFGSMLLIR